MSSDAAVLAVEGHIGEVLGLVEGGEHQAHVGEVRGPLEVVGLHPEVLTLCLCVSGQGWITTECLIPLCPPPPPSLVTGPACCCQNYQHRNTPAPASKGELIQTRGGQWLKCEAAFVSIIIHFILLS